MGSHLRVLVTILFSLPVMGGICRRSGQATLGSRVMGSHLRVLQTIPYLPGRSVCATALPAAATFDLDSSREACTVHGSCRGSVLGHPSRVAAAPPNKKQVGSEVFGCLLALASASHPRIRTTLAEVAIEQLLTALAGMAELVFCTGPDGLLGRREGQGEQ